MNLDKNERNAVAEGSRQAAVALAQSSNSVPTVAIASSTKSSAMESRNEAEGTFEPLLSRQVSRAVERAAGILVPTFAFTISAWRLGQSCSAVLTERRVVRDARRSGVG